MIGPSWACLNLIEPSFLTRAWSGSLEHVPIALLPITQVKKPNMQLLHETYCFLWSEVQFGYCLGRRIQFRSAKILQLMAPVVGSPDTKEPNQLGLHQLRSSSSATIHFSVGPAPCFVLVSSGCLQREIVKVYLVSLGRWACLIMCFNSIVMTN